MQTQIIIMLVCLIGSAFFSGTETAFTSANKTKLKSLAEEGNKRASLVLNISDKYDKLLTTLLVGNNIVNILLSAIATVFFMDLLKDGKFANYYTAISTAVITVIVLIIGEISPKTLAREHAEGFAMTVAPLIRFLMIVLTPINAIFSLWKMLLSKIFKSNNDDTVTEGELLTLVDEAHEDGSINEYDKELIENIFDFDDISAGEIATHRTDLTFLKIDQTVEEWDHIVKNSRFSRYPICGESIDDIVGVLNAREYLRLEEKTRESIFEKAVAQPYLVPQSAKADVLFRNMREKKESFAIVLDEYSGVHGIITLTDLLECLVGQIDDNPETAEENEIPSVEQIEENKWRILGSALISEVEEALSIEITDADSDTFSGFALGLYGAIPDDGSTFELSTEQMNIVIEEIKDHKIEKALVSLILPEDEEDTGDKNND